MFICDKDLYLDIHIDMDPYLEVQLAFIAWRSRLTKIP